MAKKNKIAFFCQNCGQESPKWLGKCPSCNEWNTFAEELVIADDKGSALTFSLKGNAKSECLENVSEDHLKRLDTGNSEFNRVLGGGLVPGALILLGGEPGIVLYVSVEESVNQIKLRANRIEGDASNCMILSDTSVENAINEAERIKPDLIIIDSIQTMMTSHIDSSPGSVSQVRESAGQLMKFTKISNIPILIIGHINKDGNLAGTKVLEHMVDTVLQFEGDQHHMYRMVRAVKNRFGSTSELAIFEMHQNGLREVSNPSELLINEDHAG